MPLRQIVLLSLLAAFCGFSLWVKENYPFSNYPMYGDPDPVSEYYHVENAEGQPLAIRTLSSVTCPQVGKILRKRGDDRARQLGGKRKNLPPEEWELICRETLGDLRKKATALGNQLPERMRIMHTTIEFKEGRIVETPNVFFAE